MKDRNHELDTTDQTNLKAIMRSSLIRVNYAIEALADSLFRWNDLNELEWLDDVARQTGISETRLHDIFFSGSAITLQEYCILSDFAEIDPINDAASYTARF